MSVSLSISLSLALSTLSVSLYSVCLSCLSPYLSLYSVSLSLLSFLAGPTIPTPTVLFGKAVLILNHCGCAGIFVRKTPQDSGPYYVFWSLRNSVLKCSSQGGGVLWYFYTYVGSGYFWGVQNSEFKYFWGFSEKWIFFGVWRFCGYSFGVITQLG